MAENEIEEVLDLLRRFKSGGNLDRYTIDEIGRLEMVLGVLRTFIKYHHVLFPDSLVKLTKKEAKWILKMHRWVICEISIEYDDNLNLQKLESHLLELFEGNTTLSYNYELNDFDLSKYMDCIGKNLNDVLMFLPVRVSPFYNKNWIIKPMKIVQKKIRFLRYLYATEINGYIDHEKLECLETRIQFMGDNVGQLCLAVLVNDVESTNEDGCMNNPPHLLCLIVLVELEMKKIFLGELKASKFYQSRTFKDTKLPNGFSHSLHSLLLYLRNKNLENFPNNVSAQNIDVAIEFLLVFLDADVSNHITNGKKLHEVMVKVGAIAGDVLYVVQKLLPSCINEDDTSKVSLCSRQILEKTKDLKAQMETYYKSLKFRTPLQFPTVGGLTFLDSLLRKLNEMLKSESGLDFMMKSNIGFSEKHFSSLTSIFEKEFSSLTSILEKELSSLTFGFKDVGKVQQEVLNDLQRRTINLAYEAELSIDSVLAQYNVLWHIFCSLPAIIKEIKHICAKVTEMRLNNLSLKPFSVVESSKHLPTQHSIPVNDEEIVGFENEAEELIDYVNRGTRELDVIPIVGMGGQGKTTIARKLYDKDIIVSHFDVRAWCIVSQTYSRRELLQEIFSQVTGSKDKEDEVAELADKLRRSLMERRYLIVLDDMWDGVAWDDLRPSFPNDNNGSRILLTTRLEEVAEHVEYHTPYYLPFLTPDESCRLLQKKVFQKEDCPPELQDVCQAVAEKCKGLPLVIIFVAGIIKRNKMEVSWWHEVKDALLDYLDHESEQYSLSTMQLSYDNLPDYLKPCLLYMGMFPEDATIPVSKLISLWIAEGFVQNIECERLMEEAAEGYLMDLISSNVVMVSRRSYNGKVKHCGVHDVVLHFCLEKSREENFMLAVKGHASQFKPLDWKESRVRFSFSKELPKFASLGSNTRKPFHQRLRSLITTYLGESSYNWNPFPQVSVARLLKVLDLSSHRVDYFSSATLKPLIHLKYLAVSTEYFDFHPEPHLPHLETLIVDGHTLLPASFWKMGKLRHVDIADASFDFQKDKHGVFEGSSKLENLRKLRGVTLPSDQTNKVDVLLQRCPNLQQLDINFKHYEDSPVISVELEGLTQLQSLCLAFEPPLLPSKLHLPSNLKRLVLDASLALGDPTLRVVSYIARLPSLEYLLLGDSPMLDPMYLHEQLWGSTIVFCKLKLFELCSPCISRWDASEETFPLLENLVFIDCLNLEEIPLSFANIPTLKQITLMCCGSKSLEASAVRFKEEVEALAGSVNIGIQDYPGGNIRRL